MKRKRAHGNGFPDENSPNSPIIQAATPNNDNRNANPSPNISCASVPVRSIFSRVLRQIGSSPCEVTSSSFNQQQEQRTSSSFNQQPQKSTNSTRTPNHQPVRLFGKIDLFKLI